MNLKLKGEYGVYFRVYNEGVAYRFYTSSKEDLIIKMRLRNSGLLVIIQLICRILRIRKNRWQWLFKIRMR